MMTQEISMEAQVAQKHYYDFAQKPHPFKIGDLVTIKQVILPGQANKFTPKVAGPYTIVDFVLDECQGSSSTVHSYN